MPAVICAQIEWGTETTKLLLSSLKPFLEKCATAKPVVSIQFDKKWIVLQSSELFQKQALIELFIDKESASKWAVSTVQGKQSLDLFVEVPRFIQFLDLCCTLMDDRHACGTMSWELLFSDQKTWTLGVRLSIIDASSAETTVVLSSHYRDMACSLLAPHSASPIQPRVAPFYSEDGPVWSFNTRALFQTLQHLIDNYEQKGVDSSRVILDLELKNSQEKHNKQGQLQLSVVSEPQLPVGVISRLKDKNVLLSQSYDTVPDMASQSAQFSLKILHSCLKIAYASSEKAPLSCTIQRDKAVSRASPQDQQVSSSVWFQNLKFGYLRIVIGEYS